MIGPIMVAVGFVATSIAIGVILVADWARRRRNRRHATRALNTLTPKEPQP